MGKDFLFVRFFIFLLLFSTYQSSAYTDDLGIEPGDVADLEYEIRVDNEVIDSGRVDFTIDDQQLILGFYKGVLGMKVGETKEFTVSPDEGYTSPDSPLYGKSLDFTVFVHGIATNIRDGSTTDNDTSSTSIVENDINSTNISDLVESENVELDPSPLVFIFSILLIGYSRRRIS